MAPGKLQRAIDSVQERLTAKADAAVPASPDDQPLDAGKRKSRAAKVKARIKAKTADIRGPSPNSATNLIIADVALRGGAAIARRAVERSVLGQSYTPRKAKAILDGRSLGESLAHGLLARIALNSVPGAVLVVSGLAAKTLYDRSRARKARAKGEQQLSEMAEDGAEG